MSKLVFKRIALVLITALGIGVLSTAQSNAAVVPGTNSLSLSASSATISPGETATVTLTHNWQSGAQYDTTTTTSSCAGVAAAGGTATCPTLNFYSSNTSETVGVLGKGITGGEASLPGFATTWSESSSATGVTSARSVISVRMVSTVSTAAGTYTYTITNYATAVTDVVATATFTLTVTAPTWSGIRLWVSTDIPTSAEASKEYRAATDSAISTTAGTTTATAVGYAHFAGVNAAGETKTAGGSNVCTAQAAGYCDLSVTVSGPGMVSIGGGTAAKSASIRSYNTGFTTNQAETLVIYSDGTSGTGTLSFYNGGTVLATKTITFYGKVANINLTLSDTSSVIAMGTTGYLTASVKDPSYNAVGAGTIWLWSSDTSIVSESATACTLQAGNSTFRCPITAVDTGTVTLVARDSSTIAKSETVSVGVTVRVSGSKIQSITATWDKATYRPGEIGVLTITAKDRVGGLMDSQAISNAFTVSTSMGNFSYGSNSTNSSLSTTTHTTYTPVNGKLNGVWDTTAVETRVVVMPTTTGKFDYTIQAGTGSWQTAVGQAAGMAAVTASADIVDPTQVAQDKAIANAQAAADAATDAALQAIDAANAATDAANLAAEAADAATVAAQESKDAADAATAAVESLATQVSTLMAALQAQITSLANVVAKIAKKVKA
jgi:hypothetical protein